MVKRASFNNKLVTANGFFLCLSFLTLILGEIPRFSLKNLGSIRLLDVLVLITVALSLFVLPKNLFSKLPVKLFVLFAVLNVISLGVSFFAVGEQIIVGVIHFLRLALYFSLYPSVLLFIRNFSISKLLNLLVMVGSAVATLGLLQLLLIPDISFLAQYGWDPHQFRVVSTWLDPNFLSPFLIICLSILITQLDHHLPRSRKIGQVGLLILLSFSIILTFSRSGLVYLSIFILLIGLRYYRRILIVLILALFLLIAALPSVRQRMAGIINPDVTANARLISWSESVRVGLTSPLIGVGYNNYSFYKNIENNFEQKNSSFGADSSILLMFSTTGIIGLTMFIGVFLYSIILSFRSKQRNYYILGSSLAGAMVASNFNNLLLYPLLIPVLLVLLCEINENA